MPSSPLAPAGWAGAGKEAAALRPSAEQRLGSRPRNHGPPPPPSAPAPARPTPTQPPRNPPERRGGCSTRAHKPQGPQETTEPGAPGRGSPSCHFHIGKGASRCPRWPQLLWVTRAVAMGYRTEAGWLATCHPVAAAAAAAAAGGAPGREEAGARVCGTRRGGVCASRRGAAANGRSRVQRRERHRQWGGGKAIKKTRRSLRNFREREKDHSLPEFAQLK
ncbi:E3 ubiquitin-protein ligase MARCHF11-like [Mustela nigripes]|uniref:E3 ubiquitin-protein ligase MARCHF11-like n=1 Tax=Mustela nigripes TaxID=77151 RepID=UPI002815B067|nr:E3 ubiquitin-protein ligase MARCHF11-like [Mustela nigripes]